MMIRGASSPASNIEQVEMFLKELENTDLVDEFDESLFNRLVEVIDIEKEKITVTFKDGSEVTI